MIVGLTGGVGCGKSTVASIFQRLGITVISADEIGRQLLNTEQSILAEIVRHFGPKVLNKNGSLNRRSLKLYIFRSLTSRLWLEALLHPLIKTEMLRQFLLVTPGTYIIAEIPLLIEAHWQDIVDRILVIDCPPLLQIDRVIKRDKVSLKIVQEILNTQVSRDERLANADDIIENVNDIEILQQKVEELHRYYTKLSK